MTKIKLEENSCSLNDFQADVATFMTKVKKDQEPLVIKEKGSNSAVLMDVEEYRKLVEKAKLLEEIVAARKEIKSGEGVDHDEFIRELKLHYAP
ncbi:MAG: type II toxin-antitoxin system Phd/YefM family antitoxin [Balneolaceae bacterium]